MNRAHLRAEDRVGLAHLFCEDNRIDRGRVQLPHLRVGGADTDRGDQGTHADAGGSQIVDFIDLQAGIDLT